MSADVIYIGGLPFQVEGGQIKEEIAPGSDREIKLLKAENTFLKNKLKSIHNISGLHEDR